MSTIGRITRTFPGPVVSVKLSEFKDSSFQEALSSTLSSLSEQNVSGMRPQVRKADQNHDELRDTMNPTMVTEFLTAFLIGIGKHSQSVSLGTGIRKHTREEIMYNNGLLPWRRSPVWLFIRVCMQLLFHYQHRDSVGESDLYKDFMLFMMGKLGTEFHHQSLESDQLLMVNAKLSRRSKKLGLQHECLLNKTIKSTMRKITNIVQARWAFIQKQDHYELPLSDLSRLNYSNDSLFVLPELDKFIESLNDRENQPMTNVFKSVSVATRFDANDLPILNSCDSNTMLAVETWVAEHLDAWLCNHFQNPQTPAKLAELLKQYHGYTCSRYAKNPEDLSVMILTTLELWVACDKSTTSKFSLLKEYAPGLLFGCLQNLILTFKIQHTRLSRVEKYIAARQSVSKYGPSFVFSAFGAYQSFAIRYFSASTEHQDLLKQITEEAQSNRTQKEKEFEDKKANYNQLMTQYRNIACDVRDGFNRQTLEHYEYHPKWCGRCKLRRTAESISLHVHEWPIPSDENEAKAVIFELHVPVAFGHWRDATAYVCHEVLRSTYFPDNKPTYALSLENYAALRSHFRSSTRSQRIGLISNTKPHAVTHRNERLISTSTLDDICLNNGLRYGYYDSMRNCFTGSVQQTLNLPKACTYKMPPGFQGEQFLFRPRETPHGAVPNEILGQLHNCPNNMSIEEFKALCAIPGGYNIQWHNILVQLHATVVDFKKLETQMVFFTMLRTSWTKRKRSGCRR